MPKRTLLLTCLLVWLACAIWIARDAPNIHGITYSALSVRPSQSMAIMNQVAESPHQSEQLTFARTIALDLKSGETRRLIDEPLALTMDFADDGKIHWLVSRSPTGIADARNPDEMHWLVTQSDSGKATYDRPYHFRMNHSYVVVGDRYLVSKVSPNQFIVYDLEDENRPPRGYDATRWGAILAPIKDSNRFIMQPQRAGNPASYGLLGVDDEGVPRLVASFPASSNPGKSYLDIGLKPPLLASLAPSNDRIEIRSGLNGEWVRDLQLSTKPKTPAQQWEFRDSYFLIRTKTQLRLIDWVSGTEYSAIDTQDEYPSIHGNWLSVYDKGIRRVIDIPTGKEIGRIKTNRALDYFDDQVAYTSTHEYGWTVNQYDVPSGKRIRSWRPFWYVLPVLIALILGWALWATFWVKVSSSTGGPAWLDLLLISTPVFCVLTYRAYVSGSTLDASRPVYQYAQGIAMAAATVAMVWLVFGKTRWTLRLLPLLCVCGVITAALALVFRQHQETAWHALASAFIPVAFMGFVFVPMRLLGWRLRENRSTATDEISTVAAFPIRDLFWITLLTSGLFAATRLIANGFDEVVNIRFVVWPLVISIVVGSVCLVTTLSCRRWLHFLAIALIVICFVYLAEYPVCMFIGGQWAYYEVQLLPTNEVQRVLMTFAVGLFSLLMPYRVRGWRFAR